MRIQPPRISEYQHNKIFELREQGMDSAKVARMIGVSPPTVIRNYNKQIGIVPNITIRKNYKDIDNTLIPVEELDFEKDDAAGIFCIKKFGALYQVTKYNNR